MLWPWPECIVRTPTIGYGGIHLYKQAVKACRTGVSISCKCKHVAIKYWGFFFGKLDVLTTYMKRPHPPKFRN